jgi:hypothetical protein
MKREKKRGEQRGRRREVERRRRGSQPRARLGTEDREATFLHLHQQNSSRAGSPSSPSNVSPGVLCVC